MSPVQLIRSPQSASSGHRDARAPRRRLWPAVLERDSLRRTFLSFWLYQVCTQWRNLNGVSLKSKIAALFELSRDIRIRHHSATSAPTVGLGIADDEKLTVILLNHQRPQNIGQVARYILRAGFVNRLVISNGNQAYPIDRYVGIEDSRLVLIDHDEPTGPGISFELARQYRSRYYLRVDDDIFLDPAQLQWLYWCLRQSPNVPHGIFGAAFSAGKNPAKEWPFDHRRYCNGPVDILNGLFAFTRDHLERIFEALHAAWHRRPEAIHEWRGYRHELRGKPKADDPQYRQDMGMFVRGRRRCSSSPHSPSILRRTVEDILGAGRAQAVV